MTNSKEQIRAYLVNANNNIVILKTPDQNQNYSDYIENYRSENLPSAEFSSNTTEKANFEEKLLLLLNESDTSSLSQFTKNGET